MPERASDAAVAETGTRDRVPLIDRVGRYRMWMTAVSAAIVLVLGVLVQAQSARLARVHAEVDAIRRRLDAFERVERGLLAVESAQRSFLLTARESYALSMSAESAAVERALDDVHTLADGTPLAAVARELEAPARTRLNVASAVASLRRASGLEAAAAAVSGSGGAQAMANARALVRRAAATEAGRIVDLRASTARIHRWLLILTPLGSLALVGTIVGFQFALGRLLRRQESDRDELVAANGRLQQQSLELERQARQLEEYAQVLRQSEARFRRLAEHAPDVIYRLRLHPERRYEYVSPAVERVTGYMPDDFYADPALGVRVIHPEDASRFERIVTELDHRPEPVTLRWLRADGEVVWTDHRILPVHDEGGAVIAVEGIARDITEQKLREQALLESEERFRLLVEGGTDVILVADAEARAIYASPAVAAVLGYAPEELIGEPLLTFVHPDDLEPATTSLQRLAAAPGSATEQTVRVRHREGGWRWLHARARNLLEHAAVRGIVINVRDTTESQRLEEQLRQSQKMEAIGRLAGGVAHDFNNLLTTILGNLQFAQEAVAEESELAHDLATAREAAERAADLTRQLLAFSRRQLLQPRVLQPNEVIEATTRMMRRVLGEDVDVRSVLQPDLGFVRADPGKLEQVLMNLVVNARDAMPHGGTVTIETQNVTLSDLYLQRRAPVVAGEYVMIAVTDTGVGMDAETQERIFEPFFTTKEAGHGTGLGLATVYGIMKQSGGYVWVYSEPGRGTTFKLYLPRVYGAADAPPDRTASAPGGSETVLVVEDEPGVRAFARRVLARKGYEVLEAADGNEALRICESLDGPIHLLMTDVVMPGMSGRELAERLLARRPEVRVLYASGYTEEEVVRRGVIEDSVPFLEKPYSPEALARKVREALGHE